MQNAELGMRNFTGGGEPRRMPKYRLPSIDNPQQHGLIGS